MYTIEIDFEVFKEIIARRESEEISENDVLRRLFGLNPSNKTTTKSAIQGKSWIVKGVEFPHGTKFRATYKGELFDAVVDNGCLLLNGIKFYSPSSAAVSITNNPVNGWVFWECLFPNKTNWQIIKNLR